ncbi:MAG: F0F1 ATP synthase subunit A [Verrucomicrobiae bacterium]|nr:F0F1 ATP synthase subunit A [Verrucomicrobiae bacterium]
MLLDSSILTSGSPILAAVSLSPESLFGFVSNSIFVAAIVTLLILLFMRMATRRMELIPGTKQNLVEFVVEFVLGELEGILGRKIAVKVFPLLATIFIFILVSNWFGLVPGVGSVGYGELSGPITLDPAHHYTPYLRPATADLNMNLGIAAVFMIVWLYISIQEVGVGGFLKHIFGAKGGMTGLLGLLMAVIFFIVGIIEVISIMFRPVSLSLRLFGNIFAGETLLHTMAELGEKMGWPDALAFVGRIALPIPFYFMELLVGLVQAIVFTLLCAVYVQLSTAHDEEEH